jgi:hypothetical protein
VRTFTCTVTADAAADAVFDYLSDLSTLPTWDARASRVQPRSGDGRPGSTYTCLLFHLGRPTTMTYTVLCLDRPRQIQWVGRSRYLTQCDELRLEHDSRGRTVVECRSTFSYPALSGSSEGLLTLPLRQLCSRRQAGLQAALDDLTRLQPVRRDTPA